MSFKIPSIYAKLYSIVTLVSLFWRLFLCKDNVKYILCLCTLYCFSGNACTFLKGGDMLCIPADRQFEQ